MKKYERFNLGDIKLLSGKVLKSANEAIEEEDYQWALNLTDYLLISDPEKFILTAPW